MRVKTCGKLRAIEFERLAIDFFDHIVTVLAKASGTKILQDLVDGFLISGPSIVDRGGRTILFVFTVLPPLLSQRRLMGGTLNAWSSKPVKSF